MTISVGFGRGTITPPVPVHLAGFGARTVPAATVHDDLECRAVVFRSDGATLCLWCATCSG